MEINNADMRAIVATNDQSLPEALSAILEPAGIELHHVPAESLEPYNTNGYTLAMVDGDPQAEVSQGLPVLVVISPHDPIGAYDSGADLVVDKPLRANVLLAKLRSVLRRYGVNI